MNKIKSTILGLLLLFGLDSCDLIDITPENALTYTNAFETPQEMESMLSTAQATLQGALYGLSAQEIAGAYINGVNTSAGGGGFGGVQDPTRIRSGNWAFNLSDIAHWGGYYAMIGYANIIESNIKKEWPEEFQNYYYGQAGFIKGMAYFEIARRWGEAPVVPDNDYEAPPLPKNNNREVLEAATKHALSGFNHCPRYKDLRFSDGAKITNKQYANKEMCAALLSHIYAWRGAVEEGATAQMKQEYWKESEKYASMLIDGDMTDYVSLSGSITDMLDNTLNSRYGKESIFELEFNLKYIKYMPTTAFTLGVKLFGYPYKHGVGAGDVPEYTISCKLVNELYGGAGSTDERKAIYFPETDSRYDESVELDWPDRTVTVTWVEPFPGLSYPIYDGGLPQEAPNRALFKKYHKQSIDSDDPNRPPSFRNFDCNKVIWRLADIILLRAEVRNFLGNESGAIEDLNKIRNRAKAALYPSAMDSGIDLQRAIFRERERELIYEGHRWFDVMRNKDYYKTALPAAMRNLSEQNVKDGALYCPVPQDASDYNKYMLPNKYWFSKSN